MAARVAAWVVAAIMVVAVTGALVVMVVETLGAALGVEGDTLGALRRLLQRQP